MIYIIITDCKRLSIYECKQHSEHYFKRIKFFRINFTKLIFVDLHQERKIKFLSYLKKLLENYEIAKNTINLKKEN